MDVRLVAESAITGYEAYPLLQNDLPGSGGGVEPNRIQLSGFVVDLALAGVQGRGLRIETLFRGLEVSNASLLHFRQPWSGSIDPDGGLAASSATLVTADLARRIRNQTGNELMELEYVQLLATIRALGDTANRSVQSDPFVFPIKLCDGCLIANVAACPYTAAPSNTGHPCNAAQDVPVDCCVTGDQLICPPVVAGQ